MSKFARWTARIGLVAASLVIGTVHDAYSLAGPIFMLATYLVALLVRCGRQAVTLYLAEQEASR